MVLTEEACALLERMRMDSLYWEAKEILQHCPEGTQLDAQAMYWPAHFLQQDGDLEESVENYLIRVGDRYIGNAFSLSMLQGDFSQLTITNCSGDEIFPTPLYVGEKVKPTISIVGHADTAGLFSSLLGREIAVNRISVSLKRGDILYVGQYSGPRLPEGVSVLPAGAAITWKRVIVR